MDLNFSEPNQSKYKSLLENCKEEEINSNRNNMADSGCIFKSHPYKSAGFLSRFFFCWASEVPKVKLLLYPI